MVERVDTVVVGGGQAGLSMSYWLAQQGRDHVVLERSRVAERWRSLWDSFCLVTPNWTVELPGLSYDGPEPDGFMSRDDVVAHLERYAQRTHPPLRTGVAVTAVRRNGTGDSYLLDTGDGTVESRNVVVATGGYQRPKVPPVVAGLAQSVLQLHSSEYRNPADLPTGAVLVVGTGQSGAQIAEELYRSGRRVFLSVSRCGRGPRRYRGRDGAWWGLRIGMFDKTVDELPPEARFACNLHVSGKDGGHDLNLRRFARDGVTLLGRLRGAADGRIALAPDLAENLAFADEAAARFRAGVDVYVAAAGIDAPLGDDDDPAEPVGPYEPDPVLEVDLAAEGIGTVVWATGYRLDLDWIHLPVSGEDGLVVHRRGVTPFPGLYFLGLHLLHTAKSALLLGVGEDARFLAAHISSRDN